MIQKKGNPAMARGASGITDLLAGKIEPEDSQTVLALQASRLALAYALPPATARTVAQLAFGGHA